MRFTTGSQLQLEQEKTAEKYSSNQEQFESGSK